ncbi:peptide-methionine (R)-S-oxide reductase MsrB [bacterium]|jgi:peptide-methionine (R)-S-oxide reductase|nr:peptide-methionine (R)-S-oxide reductase MsrB [bacterium]
MNRSAEDWRSMLTEEEHRVLRENGTERPHTSELNAEWRDGVYACKGCGKELFESHSKFNAGCGWPSFDREAPEANITQIVDRSHGMVRIEVRCSGCDSHLGHVFPDGPAETGTRYCINGVCLTFQPVKG